MSAEHAISRKKMMISIIFTPMGIKYHVMEYLSYLSDRSTFGFCVALFVSHEIIEYHKVLQRYNCYSLQNIMLKGQL